MEFTTYRNENGGEVEVHEVTEDTKGTYPMVGRGPVDVRPGDYLVRSANSNQYETIANLDGYTADKGSTVSAVEFQAPTTSQETQSTGFDPTEHSASEVKSYLKGRDDEGDYAEYNRVVNAEKAGKNRSTAYPE